MSASWETDEGAAMATNVVNLDALIPREDFAIEGGATQGTHLEKITIVHLEGPFFGPDLRKPDFQRETVHWSPNKVVDLVRAFVDADLIPAVILWRAGRFVFVVDGAHRLSALLAWIHDDYGDRKRSLDFFGGVITDEQRKIAKKTRELVNQTVGSYKDYVDLRGNPDAPAAMMKRLTNLSLNPIIAQWVPAADVKSAEASFFKINQEATPIDPTERRILRARRSASAIAARAITHGGTGHKYWSDYAPAVRAEIEDVAHQLFAALYEPPIGDAPIKTIDLPLAGRGYNALPFIFDLVNWANDIPEPKGDKEADKQEAVPDPDGARTIVYLKRVKDAIDLLTGNAPSSLGIHPVVYCYTRGGEFQPAALLAIAEFIRNLSRDRGLREFTRVRRKFEDFLLTHKDFITLTIKRTGAGRRSLKRLVRYFEFVAAKLIAGLSDAEIVSALEADTAEFLYLVAARAPSIRDGDNPTRRMSRSTKSASFLAAATQSPVRCAICGGMVHKNSIQIDHKTRARDGGGADATNAQVAHPYCNSTIKG